MNLVTILQLFVNSLRRVEVLQSYPARFPKKPVVRPRWAQWRNCKRVPSFYFILYYLCITSIANCIRGLSFNQERGRPPFLTSEWALNGTNQGAKFPPKSIPMGAQSDVRKGGLPLSWLKRENSWFYLRTHTQKWQDPKEDILSITIKKTEHK